MPQIIVTAERPESGSAVLHRERVSAADFASRHFAEQLLERIDWAVKDAAAEERCGGERGRSQPRDSQPREPNAAATLEQALVGLA